MIEFGQPFALGVFAAGLVAIGLWIWRCERRRRRLVTEFADEPMADRLTASFSPARHRAKVILSATALLLFLLALARPQLGSVTEEIELQGIDILIALDTSRSMLAEDHEPNRLSRAKLAVLDLVSRLNGDRVGLIAFAGKAFLQTPLTLDYHAFRQSLEALDTDTIPAGGTDIAGAIEEAIAYFEAGDHHRMLIVISDGEDLEAKGIVRAREAAEAGITIYTVGVGSSEGQPIPLRGPGGELDYVRDSAGNPVLSRLDEDGLRQIARETGGIYRNLGNRNALNDVYAMIRSTVDQATLGTLTRSIPIERYQWPLALGLLCLIAEWVIHTRRRERTVGPARTAATTLLLFGGLLAVTNPSEASPRAAERAYQNGEYEQAVALWREAAEKDPDDARLHYNIGNGEYRAGRFSAAIKAYESALPLADVALQERIFFNLGNAQYQLGMEQLESDPAATTGLWEEALKNYGNSLAINPDAGDAVQNQQWVKDQFSALGARITVAPNPSTGGSTSEGGIFLPGTILPLRAEPADGWRFVRWEGAEVADPDKANTELVVRENADLQAIFVETRRLEVVVDDPDRGTAKESGRFDRNSQVPIEAKAADHFVFKEWISEDLEIADPSNPSTTVLLSGDGTVTATFVEAFYLEVTSDPPIAGRLSESGYYEKYKPATLKAEPRPGFSWLGWSGRHVPDISDFNAQETEIMMNGDRKAIAQFERIWKLVVLPDKDEGGTTAGGGNFPVGSVQPIQASPNEGFVFERWEGPGVLDPQAANTSVTVQDGNQDVIAIFRKEESDEEQQEQDQNPEGNQENNGNQNQDQQPSEEDQDSEQQDDASGEQSNEGEGRDSASGPESQEDQQDASSKDEAKGTEGGEESEMDQQAQPRPEGLTEEEAQQLLQMLRQDERILPLRHRQRQDDSSTSGRDW